MHHLLICILLATATCPVVGHYTSLILCHYILGANWCCFPQKIYSFQVKQEYCRSFDCMALHHMIARHIPSQIYELLG